MNKKTILFTIELADRELFAKCLLAIEMVKRGFRVYIGSFRAIHEIHGGIKSCIFFHKSTYQRRMLQYKRKMNATIAVMDEEAGVAIPTSRMDDFCRARFQSMTKSAYDYVFTVGEGYTRRLLSMPNMEGIRILTTGWPRIDLWREEYAVIHAQKVAEIREAQGNYWLFVSSFGFTSRAGMEFKVKRAYSELRVKSLYNTFQAFNNYIELIKRLAEDRQQKIIVRPHTSESIEEWTEIFSDCPNVLVIREGDVTPWLLAAAGVIVYRSTVALQAALNGIPTVQYKINDIDGIDDVPVFKVSKCTDSVEGVRDYLHSFKGAEEREFLKRHAVEVLEEHVASLSGMTAAQRIAEILAGVDVVPQPEIRVHPVMKALSYTWKRYKHAEHHFRKVFLKKKAGYRLSRFDKLPNGIRAAEIESIVERLQTAGAAHERRPINCRQASIDLVVLE